MVRARISFLLCEVLCIEVLAFELCDLILQLCVLLLQLRDFDCPHTVCFLSQQLPKLQVVSDGLLGGDLGFDSFEFSGVALHLGRVCIPALGSQSHLGDLV